MKLGKKRSDSNPGVFCRKFTRERFLNENNHLRKVQEDGNGGRKIPFSILSTPGNVLPFPANREQSCGQFKPSFCVN